ncbi:MAG: hypothetical protein A2Y94_07195 [Caldithrix sp. RBG_13_44_9]|nr:MAG: hypothetical protein A2Y94_07195 [Caldithrix sp. RBG_13_44_9]
MAYLSRYLETHIKEDLAKKMVFMSGPRQSGKTTLAKKLLQDENLDFSRYLNWDASTDRENIIREQFPAGPGLLILDEIHKYSRWRQVVKGLYDKRKEEIQILVSGSGRLDYYRHGGDSLQGRYHFYRLHPLSFREINAGGQYRLMDLFNYGGFPEPFLLASERESRRWSKEYRTRVIQEDLNSLENVKDLALLENLVIRLPDLVGSPLSVNAISKDLQVAHQTLSRWLIILENLFMIFRIFPFGAPKIRAVKKEAKHYHFDWTVIEDESFRFENMVACHLLKWCHLRQDYEGLNTELRYFRDIDKREVDFVLIENNKPRQFVECKLQQRDTNPALRYLKQRFPEVYTVQIALRGEEDYINKDGIHICPAEKYLLSLI